MIKTVILAGGLGTRISEETRKIPKAMFKIGNLPIIHHIIKIYESNRYNDFIICSGFNKDNNEISEHVSLNKQIKIKDISY